MSGQRGKRVQGADQRRDGNQFVNQPREAQGNENDGVTKLIAAFSDVRQLIDQVEETEECEKCREHQKNGCECLPHQVTLVETQAEHQTPLLCHGISTTIRL